MTLKAMLSDERAQNFGFISLIFCLVVGAMIFMSFGPIADQAYESGQAPGVIENEYAKQYHGDIYYWIGYSPILFFLVCCLMYMKRQIS